MKPYIETCKGFIRKNGKKQCSSQGTAAVYYNFEGIDYCPKCYKKLQSLERKKALAARMATGHPSFRDKFQTVSERVCKLRQRATPAEKCFQDKLKRICPVQFKFQRAFIKGDYYAIVDFHISSRNICIEIDGGYHNDPDQQRKDEIRDSWLIKQRGQVMIRITNEKAFDISDEELLQMISIGRRAKDGEPIANMKTGKLVAITHQILTDGLSIKGGWSAKQLAVLGLKFGHKTRGWKKRLIGTTVHEEKIKKFLKLKNKHVK